MSPTKRSPRCPIGRQVEVLVACMHALSLACMCSPLHAFALSCLTLPAAGGTSSSAQPHALHCVCQLQSGPREEGEESDLLARRSCAQWVLYNRDAGSLPLFTSRDGKPTSHGRGSPHAMATPPHGGRLASWQQASCKKERDK